MRFKRSSALASAVLSALCITTNVFAAGQTINVPQRPLPPSPTVAIIKDNAVNYSTMVTQALDAALGTGGIGNLVQSSKTVLIKPNLTMSYSLAVTDWRLVRALVDQINTVNGGAAIYIADGSSTNSTHTIMTDQGYTAANFPEVTFLDFNSLAECPTNNFILADYTIENATKQLAAIISEVDVFIDMPKMKTHTNTGISGALKNIGLGVPSLAIFNNPSWGSNKGNLHRDTRLETVDHVLCRVPDFTIMDAIVAMEGQGPGALGTAVPLNLVIASKDLVAVDAVACEIMGIPSYLITHLVVAANENAGEMNPSAMTITGNSTIAAVKRNFVRAVVPQNPPIQQPFETMLIPYRATTVIRPAPATMTIDGDLGEWGNANLFTVDLAEQLRGNGFEWGGPADCSIRGQFMYDANNLYIALHVRDDIKQDNANTGAAIRNGESIELYLGTDPNQYNSAHTTTNDSRFDHVLGISYSASPQAYLFSHNRAVTGFMANKVDIGDGYVIEAVIPWSNFNNVTYAPYRQFGLNVALNDADVNAATIDDKIFWNAAKDADVETNPQKNGIAYLDQAGGLYGTPSYALNITSVNGSVVRSPDRSSYDAGTVVTLTPQPISGYTFAGWSGDAAGTFNPTGVVMNGPKNITAVFNPAPVVGSIVVSPSGAIAGSGGTVPYSAVAFDQYGVLLPTQPVVAWSVSGGGTISSGGVFTAGSVAGGPFTVTAASGSVSGTAAVTVTSPAAVFKLNCGSSSAVAPFTGDQYFSGGTQYSVTSTIAISGITNPAPQAVYQCERFGNSTYTLPNLTPGAQYTVRLHFAELYWTATGKRVFNVTINGTRVLSNFDLYATAGARYKAILREFSATANSSGQVVIAFATVTDNASICGIEIVPVTFVDLAPTIATPPSANPAMVIAATTALAVLGADDNGEPGLTYTWSTTGTPPAAVAFSVNGTNAAKATTATFSRAGTYTFQVLVKDSRNLTATGSVRVVVRQLLTSIVVTPSNSTIAPGVTQQFAATARDQFGADFATPPAFTWSLPSGGGQRGINANGVVIALNSTGGPFPVVAASSGVSGTTNFTIATAPTPPTIAAAASAVPNPVTGVAAALSVLGADDNGEVNLIYSWAVSGTPPAAVTFGANGTNAAKATTATFTRAGSYVLQATIRDQSNLTVISTVAVTVNQTFTGIVVSPPGATIATSGAQQFTALARDQFATNMTTQPTFVWTVSGGGTISPSGLFTAGTTAGGPYTVTAASGGINATASVTVTAVVTPTYRINCGSTSAVSPFTADQYVSGGTMSTITNAITISGITNPAPQAVYQSERYGTSTYTMPGLTANAPYTVRLHFAELYWSASGQRLFNVIVNGATVLSNFDVYVAAGAKYKAVLREFATTANSSGQIIINFNTITNNATISGIEIVAATPNVAPTVATAAAATPNPVTGTTTALSVLGADDNGEANLTYTWAATGTPPAAVTFSVNGTNAAKATTATFARAGAYQLQATIRDLGSLTITSTVAVTVNQTLTSIAVLPASAGITPAATQQFTATARDQFATNLTTQPTFSFTVSGGGTISSGGLFTAGSTAGGPYTVTALAGSVSGTASVTVATVNLPPTVAMAASASPNPVTGTTTALSVLGADDNGEANLTYTWATTGTPPAAVTFSVNGTNAAKATTATFTRAGTYQLQATIRDLGNLTISSTVAITVNQTLTSIVVTPASATIATSGVQQFTATARDQFATNLATQPTFTFTVSGGGAISSGGLFTAGAAAGGPYTVTAASGTLSGAAQVTIQSVSTGVVIYDDLLAGGYGNYSWGGTYNTGDASPVKVGSASISITYTSGWGGLQLQKISGTQTHTGFTSYRFWAHGGTSGTRQCQFFTRSNAGQESSHVNVDIPGNTWTQFTITLSSLGNPADAKTIVLQDRSGNVGVEFNIDQLELR